MGQQRRKLWVGIGTCVLLGTSGTAAGSGPAAPSTHAAEPLLLASAGGEGGEGGEGGAGPMSVFGGGEGGEGGEGGGAPSATESPGVYFSQLAFMLGHLHVARELYEAGDAATGATHLGHPVAEHLASVEAALKQRGHGDVVDHLRALADAADDGAAWSAVADRFEAARTAIREAMTDLDRQRLQDPAFIARVLVAIALKARQEYDEAIEGGRFVHEHEYHDARGFLQVGRELLDRHADTLRAADADAYADLARRFEDLMAAWPSVQPPAEPVLSVSQLYGRVSSFEFAANRF